MNLFISILGFQIMTRFLLFIIEEDAKVMRQWRGSESKDSYEEWEKL